MSTKFEQLLDLIVNEEMEKANELFHEIVVEKSRDIYENLIAQEAEEQEESVDEADEDAEESVDEADEDAEESVDEADEDAEESVDESDDPDMEEGYDENADENMDLEDSFELEGGDDEGPMGGDPSDRFGSDTGMGDMGDDGLDADAEEEVKMDIQAAIDQLQAAFDKMGGGDGMDDMGGDDMGAMDKMGGDDDEKKSDEMMGFSEGRRMTREYREKVGNDWEKNSQKQQGAIVGKNTGEGMPSADNSNSPISSGKGKPTTGATAANILGGKGGQEGGSNTGTSPNKPTKGINPESGEKFTKGVTTNLDGSTTGVKKLSKVAGGHGAEKKGAAPGPVGAGTGDKAGQTSVAPETKKQFLKPFSN